MRTTEVIDNTKDNAYFIVTAGASRASEHSPEGSISSQLAGRSEGPADAYRHLLISAELTRRFDERYARLLLDEHEGEETGPSTAMDKYNNEIGIAIGKSVRAANGKWSDIIALSQEVMIESLADFTYADIIAGADWQQQPDGNLALQRTFQLSNGIAVKGISLQLEKVWKNHPKDSRGKELLVPDCNWPTRDGSWLNRFVPESYVYKGGNQIINLISVPLNVVTRIDILTVDGVEQPTLSVYPALYRLDYRRRLSSLPEDIDIQVSNVFSQVAAATDPSEPLVIDGQTTEKFLSLGTDAAEAFNLIPGSEVPGGGTLVYTLGGDDEIGINGGNNWIDGGNGTDTVSYSSATPDTQGVPLSVIVGSSGSKNATAIVERTINPEQNTDTLVNVEKIIGTTQDDIFTLTEVVDEMVLDGGEGEDTLSWGTMTGFPSVNVQYGKMQLSRAYSVGIYMLGKSYGLPYSCTIQASSPVSNDNNVYKPLLKSA